MHKAKFMPCVPFTIVLVPWAPSLLYLTIYTIPHSIYAFTNSTLLAVRSLHMTTFPFKFAQINIIMKDKSKIMIFHNGKSHIKLNTRLLL